jgi:guanosine-3',5'-bis(diphosphate) 3'-pyrophosphohydrolase
MIPTLNPIYNNLKTRFSPKDFAIIDKAYLFAQEKHAGQKRASGEDYVLHPLRVAIELSRLRPEINAVVAAFLHDILEDTTTPEKTIGDLFGEDVLFLVKGLSNIRVLQKKVVGQTKNIEKLENFRNLILATAKDVRVILIKLFDRLDNMRSIWALSAESQYKNGVETLEIYAPLAYRLGLGQLGQLLEEVSFPYVYPKEFMSIKNKVADYYYRIEKLLCAAREEIEDYFKANKFAHVEIQFRKKTFSSIYRKLKKEGSFDKIYDIIAFRIITKNINDCYVALGLMHRL